MKETKGEKICRLVRKNGRLLSIVMMVGIAALTGQVEVDSVKEGVKLIVDEFVEKL